MNRTQPTQAGRECRPSVELHVLMVSSRSCSCAHLLTPNSPRESGRSPQVVLGCRSLCVGSLLGQTRAADTRGPATGLRHIPYILISTHEAPVSCRLVRSAVRSERCFLVPNMRRDFCQIAASSPPPSDLPLHGVPGCIKDDVYHVKQSLADQAGKWRV